MRTSRLLGATVVAVAVTIGVAVNAFAVGDSLATTTVCIKPNGQIRAVTPSNPGCVEPEAANEWTVNGVKEIAAGPGLVARDDGGFVHLQVDPGLLEAASAGQIFAGFDDGPRDLPNAFPPPRIAALALPAGSYAIFVKVSFHNPFLSRTATVNCRLEAGGDFDELETVVERADEVDVPGISDVEGTTDLTQSLAVVHRFDAPDSVVLRCGQRSSAGTAVDYRDLKIIAIRGSSLSNVFLGE
jgi:hypothetical protein